MSIRLPRSKNNRDLPHGPITRGGLAALHITEMPEILSYFTPDNGGNMDLHSATDDLVHHLRVENRGMQVAGDQRKVRVDGSEALITMLETGSPYGGAETDALLTVMRPEGLFYMVFIAPQRNFSSLQGAFEQMLNSIRFNG